MRRTIAAAFVLTFAPLRARAQSICQDEPQQCAVPAVIGTQPCATATRWTLDAAANGVLGDEAPAMPALRVGCTGATVDGWGRVPCQILKALAWARTGWRQFCTDECGDSDRTVVGRGCRFGMFQIAESEAGPDIDLTRVAAELPYNAGAAARRLALEWGRTPCVGDQLPDVAEHWYFAVWAADAFTYANNPNNPAFPMPRQAYRSQGGSFDRGSYPFQEVVFGIAASPPRESGEALWEPSPLALPASEQICGTEGCAPGTIDAPTQVHDRACPPATPPVDGGVPDASAPDGGDAGPPVDGGPVDVPTSVVGCGCRAGGGPGRSPLPILAFCAVAAALRCTPWSRSRRTRGRAARQRHPSTPASIPSTP